MFLVDVWRACATNGDIGYPTRGIIPFRKRTGGNKQYDLSAQNDAFFARLRRFVNKAQLNKVAVQITLFDRVGLLEKRNKVGFWYQSPYNAYGGVKNSSCGGCANNINGRITDPKFFCLYDEFDDSPGKQGDWLNDNVNDLLIDRCLDEVGGYPNVIWEIMNEPNNTSYLPNSDMWHQHVADLVVSHP